MPRPALRKLTLADLMVLILATGFGLGCYVFLDNQMFQGKRYLYGIREALTARTVREVLDRVVGGLSMALIGFGAWTFVLPVLERRRIGGRRPRPWRRPGYHACVAASFGLVACGATAGIGLLARWHEMARRPGIWYQAPIADAAVIFPGLAAATAWVCLLAMGRWQASRDPLDRLGRFIGGLWIVSALAFAIRLFRG